MTSSRIGMHTRLMPPSLLKAMTTQTHTFGRFEEVGNRYESYFCCCCRLYPTVKLIQELAFNKDSDDSIEEVLRIMVEVKAEHQDKGLGLAHVYKAGMTACADFGRHRETLRLFDEASFYCFAFLRLSQYICKRMYSCAVYIYCFVGRPD